MTQPIDYTFMSLKEAMQAAHDMSCIPAIHRTKYEAALVKLHESLGKVYNLASSGEDASELISDIKHELSALGD